MSLPDRDTLEELSKVLREAGANAPNALGHACKAFANGDFNLETARAWAEVQRTDRKSQIFLSDTKGGIPDPENEHSADTNRKTPNPFSRDAWNITEQGRLLKSNPKMAAALAAAAGVRIGATKPKAA